MGMVVMSKRELNRLDVLSRLDGDRLTARAAAELMTVTLRQTYRLLGRYRAGGALAIANQRRGRPSNNRLPDVVRDHAIALVRERYADFGPTFAAEKLAERHDLRVSRETLCMTTALILSPINGCDYCLATHTYLGTHFGKALPEEMAANRYGRSSDPKTAAAILFAKSIADKRGKVSD